MGVQKPGFFTKRRVAATDSVKNPVSRSRSANPVNVKCTPVISPTSSTSRDSGMIYI